MILTQEQEMIRDSMRAFAQERLAPFAPEWDKHHTFPAEALKELGQLVGSGTLRPRESVAQGLAAAPEAFLGMLKGKNFGKQLVKLV